MLAKSKNIVIKRIFSRQNILLILSVFVVILLLDSSWASIKNSLVLLTSGSDAKKNYQLGSDHLGGNKKYDVQLAQRFFLKSYDVNSALPRLNYQLARTYFLTQDYERALFHVNTEIRLYPEFSRSYYLRGLIFGYDKQYSLAEESFKEFIQRQPDEWAGYVDLSWIYFAQGKFIEMKALLEQIVFQQKNPWILNAYGLSLYNLGEYDASVRALTEAKRAIEQMQPEVWGQAYVGNNPAHYWGGLQNMRQNISANLTLAEQALLQKIKA